MPEDTPPRFVDAGPLPPEAHDNGKVADQSPIVDTEVTDETEDVLIEDQS